MEKKPSLSTLWPVSYTHLGRISIGDINKANLHAKGKKILLGYELACADINGDGRVTTSDVNKMNLHNKGKSLLW